MDDRELTFMIKGHSSDYQDLAVQCAVVWRVADAARLGERVDFTIDLRSGAPLAKPEDQIRSVLTGLVLQFADTYLKQTGVQALLIAGLAPLQAVVHAAFRADPILTGMGLEIVSIRVSALTPSSELSRTLQSPTFESLQQKADEAIFSRRALAVDKERAIAANELSNANARAESTAEAAAQTIRAEADASAKIVGAGAEATRIRAVEKANADMQLARMTAIADVPPAVLFALAAQEFATKLQMIDSLTISPDTLSGLMGQIKALVVPAAKS